MPNAWPWGQIITTVLGSGVVAALANNGIAWLRASRERWSATRMTARRAAEHLERYAREVAAVAQSWQSTDPHDDAPGPAPWPELPSIRDLDWSNFPARLSDRAISYDTETAMGVAAVRDAFNYDDDMAIDLAIEVSLDAGLKAWDLAADLRNHAKFPAGRSRVHDYYDYVEWMRDQTAARAKDRRQRLEESKRNAAEADVAKALI